MNNKNGSCANSPKSITANFAPNIRHKLIDTLDGTWVDTELIYVDTDKYTVLEKELVYIDRLSTNCLSFNGKMLDVSMFVEEDDSVSIANYATLYTFENNILSFLNKYSGQDVSVEILKLTTDEMWIVINEEVVELSPMDTMSKTIYEVAKLVKQ